MPTNFKVLVVVKGEFKQENIDIVHFRLKDGVAIPGANYLVSFPTRPKKRESGDKQDYMLFLKKKREGRWTFVSGQVAPSLSVK